MRVPVRKRSLFYFPAVLVVILSVSCGRKQDSDQIVLAGTIRNFSDTSTIFSYDVHEFLGTTQKMPVKINPDGSYRLVLESGSPLKGFFSLGRVPKTYDFTFTTVEGRDSSMSVESADFRMVYVWLEPGDSVNMDLDVERIRESLVFSGSGAANNIFVNDEANRFDDYKHRYLGNYYNYTFRQPDDFKRTTDALRDVKAQYLTDYQLNVNLSPRLVKVYQTDYFTEAVGRKIAYPGSHEGFNNGRAPVLPDDYFSFLDSLPGPESIGPLGIGYYYYLNSVWRRKFEKATANGESRGDFYGYIKSELPERIAYEFMAYSLARDFRKVLYDEFGPECPYSEIAQVVKNKYRHMEGMLEGTPAPEFTLPDVNGNPVSLKDLHGKFVYIDFWATWCGPCIKEIPSLKKLEEEFQGKNILFVSISYDKAADTQKWKNFVRDSSLTGIQLIADQEVHDLLSKTFNIDLIPRFVLLDPDGKIVNANAPRPSNPRLRELFTTAGVR